MADRWLNIPLGGDIAQDGTEGSSDTAQFVAVRVTYDATGASKEQFVKALNAAIMYALQDNWPPV